MGNKLKKCKSPGCSKWVVHGNKPGYCQEHLKKIDPLSLLYLDKSHEECEADERTIRFFLYLLNNRSFEELFIEIV